MKNKNKIGLIVTIFFALGFVIYGNIINGEFFLDDSVHIVANDYIRDFRHTKEIFSQDSLAGAGFRLGWYRPLLLLSYTFDYSLWGLDSTGYHLTNIFLHVASALLLFFIVLKIFQKINVAFLSGLIFLIHPIQTEAVSYVSGRADLLLVFFLLISFFFFLSLASEEDAKKRMGLLFLSLAGFTLALLSKETAIVFPVLLALYCVALRGSQHKLYPKLFLIIPFAILTAIYQVLRMTVLNFNNSYVLFGQDFVHRILMFFKTLPLYWQKLIWPINLRYHYETQLPIERFDSQVMLSVLIILALIIFSWFYKPLRRLILFGFGWFFISMAPVSGVLVPINFIMGERWLYFSAIGLFVVVAAAIIKFFDFLSRYKIWKIITFVVLAVYLIFLIVLGIKRNFVWHDGFTFAQRALSYFPQEPKLHGLLANEYVKRNQEKEALEEFEIAITLDPKEPTYVYNLGVLYANRNFNAETMKKFDSILRSSTVSTTAFGALANRYAARKDYMKAIKLLEKITEIQPDLWQVYYKLGEYYFLNKQTKQAISAWGKVLVLNPDNKDVETKLEILKKQN